MTIAKSPTLQEFTGLCGNVEERAHAPDRCVGSQDGEVAELLSRVGGAEEGA